MGRLPNPYLGTTYIADNPRMEEPPAHFLGPIHDYDSALVILPSRQRPFSYVIARRIYNKSWSQVQASTITQPDTLMCVKYNLVPVCLMFKTGPSWNPEAILSKLRARDMWAHGGADKVADMLEAQEDAEKQKIKDDFRQEMWHRSGDAWRSYTARTGQRTFSPGPSQPGAATKSSSSRTDTGVTLT